MSRRMRGFTLIEVLLATVLLAAGLALALTTLRAATATVQRGETLAQRSERMRAVEGFLRRRIASATPVGFQLDPVTGEAVRFIGEPQRIRFVADLPNYLGQGGPHLHDIAVDGTGATSRLTVAFALVLAGETVELPDPRPPEPLVDDLAELRLRYRGFAADGTLGDWQEQWGPSTSLPLQVAIDIASDSAGSWPAMVITLPQGTGELPGGEIAP
ncbi:prepilin-type N-terminal cleavage/methylation domain-containing protein [Luteimonas sp. BDR2-5]|uniref:prepilin-type N-terminal cleavage/methylation domain-containing protein n=1 Tax=Proluteimonas luteida TaxID=2878685 RepID=UPI001E50DFA1|nr:prepilin-type N-terminal cleavage/methylation domain-containing protein [Luteimonas sp. BDR2-5]MCD9027401.1 prepilin-type N-terminal cleavage/methylation domain-containing protein [Luteimonas sp. BDR2-5]